MPDIKTDLDWDAIVAALEGQPWEPRSDFGAESDEEERMLYLGSCFALTPSGKYYLPWACSNVERCPHCNGSGQFSLFKRRVLMKRVRRARRMERFARKRGRAYAIKQWPILRRFKSATAQSCTHCGGLGSREAYLDDLWRAKVEEEAEARGLFLTNGDGDPTDIFVGEVRTKPDEEEEDEILEAS